MITLWAPFGRAMYLALDQAVQVALLSAAGVAFSAILLFLGGVVTQRQARRATESTERIGAAKAESEAFENAREHMQATIAELRQQIAELRQELAEMRKEGAEYRTEARSMRRRIVALECSRSGDRLLIRALATYALRLQQLLRDRQVEPPPPPDDLSLVAVLEDNPDPDE